MKTRLRARHADDPFASNRGVQVVINPYPGGDGSRTCYLTTRTRRPPTRPVGGPADRRLGCAGVTPGLLRRRSGRTASLIDDTVSDLTSSEQNAGHRTGLGTHHHGRPGLPAVRGLTVEFVFDATNTRYLDFIDAALEILRQRLLRRAAAARVPRLDLAAVPGALARVPVAAPRSAARARSSSPPPGACPRPRRRMWPDTPILLARIEAEGRKFGGIQHWGMNDEINASDVARAYPRLDTWRRVRWELTKGGTITHVRQRLHAPLRAVRSAAPRRSPPTTTATARPTSRSGARAPAPGGSSTAQQARSAASSGARPATSPCPATTTATAKPTSPSGVRAPARGS